MEFRFSDAPGFDAGWQEMERESPNVSWRYLHRWRQYKLIHGREGREADLSFVVFENGRPVALCPLFLEVGGGVRQFTYVGGFQEGPLLRVDLEAKFRKKVEAACYAKIDELARQRGVAKAMVLLDPLAEDYRYNVLTEYGYLDASVCTAIVDLALDEKRLWADVRKSFKSLVHRGKEKFGITAMDWRSASFEVHEAYRRMHRKAAGRATRPQETFDLQFEMLKDDHAMLLRLREGDRDVGFSYFFHSHGGIFYASAADDPDYASEVPLQHVVIWSAMEYYRARPMRRFELGCQQFGPQVFDQPSKKDMDISFFKRGFGGAFRSVYRGVRYYDRDVMRRELAERVAGLVGDAPAAASH